MSDARERAEAAFVAWTGASPRWLVRAPGRVNLLGEHVDYNGGLVLPSAIDRALWVAASPAPDDASTHLRSIDLDGEARLRGGSVRPAWARPANALASALAEAGFEAPGVRALIASDVPVGGGLSSSSALAVALALVWGAAGRWRVSASRLAGLCQRAENRFLGVRSGIMDPWIIVHGRARHAFRLDCRSLEARAVALPPGVSIVIAESGVPRQLGATPYNRRREECEHAVRTLRRCGYGIETLRDVDPGTLVEAERRLPTPLARRVRHVVLEIERVRFVTTGVGELDAVALGKAMVASHESLRDDYEVSVPELDALVEIAIGQRGCYGSRLTGAGFGGCTVSLVDDASVAPFAEELAAGYARRHRRRPAILVCRAGDGARVAR